MSLPPGWQIAETVPFTDFKLCPEDRAGLGRLSNTPEIQKWIFTRIKEYRARILSLLSLHNASVPINCRLPREVLSEIFGYLPPARQRQKQFRAFKFLHVCRLWRQIILETPSFWVAMLSQATVDSRSRHENNRFAFVLDKTGVLPLSATVCEYLGGGLIEMLIPHAHRLSSMNVTYIRSHLYRMLSTDLPRLRHLSYQDPDVGNNHLGAPYLDPNKFPQLYSLRMPTALFKATTTFGSLQHLHLTQSEITVPEDTHAFALDPLLEALRCCPYLKSLTATFDLLVTSTESGAYPHRQAVHLPSLLDLTLHHTNREGIALLYYLAIPPATVLSIRSLEGWFSNALPANLTKIPYISTATDVTFSMPKIKKLETPILEMSGPCGQMSVLLDEATWHNESDTQNLFWYPYFVGDLANVLLIHFRCVTSLTIGQNAEGMNLHLHCIVAMLRALPLLNYLNVFNEADTVLEALDPIVGRLEGHGCLCPFLSSLVFRWSWMTPFKPDRAARYYIRRDEVKDGGQIVHQGEYREGDDSDDDGEAAEEEGEHDGNHGRRRSTRTHAHLKISQDEWAAEGSHASYPVLEYYSRVIKCVQRRRMKRGCCAFEKLSIQIEDPRYKNEDQGEWGTAELQRRLKGRLEGVVEQVTVTFLEVDEGW